MATVDLNAWLSRHPRFLIENDDRFWAEVKLKQAQLAQFGSVQSPTVLLAEADPVRFLSGAVAAIAQSCPVFLCNPAWGDREWAQVRQQIRPDLIWGIVPETWRPSANSRGSNTAPSPGLIAIPTGGSSGRIKFALHTWETLSASAEGFRTHFQADAPSAYCVLPLHHVSGLMQAVRALCFGGFVAIQPFRELLAGPPLGVAEGSFISLVPTQLQRLLSATWEAIAWLKQFRAVLVGGAPAGPHLLERSRQLQLPLALTYGMTETASHIAALCPQKFLSGRVSSGSILPHAQVTICDDQGNSLAPEQPGRVCIQGRSLGLGYWGQDINFQHFHTDDIGYLDRQSELHIVGRASRKIISGGESIFPEEIEAALQETGLVNDAYVVGLPDDDWGQAVTVMLSLANPTHLEQVQQALKKRLSSYKQPKHWICVQQLPRNPQGKIDQSRIVTLAKKILHPGLQVL